MDKKLMAELRKLNLERKAASELIAAVCEFLEKMESANCPRLKAQCDELVKLAVAMTDHRTKCYMKLLNGDK